MSSWSQTTPPCVSCKTKPKSCELLDAFGKKFNTKTDLDYLSQFCNASWTDAQLLTVLKEINSWSSDTRRKEFITAFGTTAAFRNGIIAAPHLAYGWAVLPTTDLTQLATANAWKTPYPVLFADLKTLDKAKQIEFYNTFNSKTADLQNFQNKAGLAQTWALCSITPLTFLQTIHDWRVSKKKWGYRPASSTTSLAGAAAQAQLLTDLQAQLNGKTIVESLIDLQKRLSFVIPSPDRVTYDLVSVQLNSNEDYIITTYNLAYNPTANRSIDVGVSTNRLVPDYTRTISGSVSTLYLYPVASLPSGRLPIVRIRMTGKRKTLLGDFKAANVAAGLTSLGEFAPTGYVWHHMDDFEIDAGLPYCSMQLVESNAHTRVAGMAHSGSVAQWKAYYVNKVNAPNQLFYEN